MYSIYTTGWTTKELGSDSQQRLESFLPVAPRKIVGPTGFYKGYREWFPAELKRQERETDRSLLYSAEVKNGGAIYPLPMSSLHTTL
jgi:hypothetical protein